MNLKLLAPGLVLALVGSGCLSASGSSDPSEQSAGSFAGAAGFPTGWEWGPHPVTQNTTRASFEWLWQPGPGLTLRGAAHASANGRTDHGVLLPADVPLKVKATALWEANAASFGVYVWAQDAGEQGAACADEPASSAPGRQGVHHGGVASCSIEVPEALAETQVWTMRVKVHQNLETASEVRLFLDVEALNPGPAADQEAVATTT